MVEDNLRNMITCRLLFVMEEIKNDFSSAVIVLAWILLRLVEPNYHDLECKMAWEQCYVFHFSSAEFSEQFRFGHATELNNHVEKICSKIRIRSKFRTSV